MQSQTNFPSDPYRSGDSFNQSVVFIGDGSVMTTGQWFLTMFLLGIPLVNIILLLVWGFGSSGNLNRRNYCRASMLWMLIAIVLYSCIFAFIFAAESGNY